MERCARHGLFGAAGCFSGCIWRLKTEGSNGSAATGFAGDVADGTGVVVVGPGAADGSAAGGASAAKPASGLAVDFASGVADDVSCSEGLLASVKRTQSSSVR